MKANSNEEATTNPLSVVFSDKARASSEPYKKRHTKQMSNLATLLATAGSFHRIF